MKRIIFLHTVVFVLTSSFLQAQSLKNENKFIIAPSMCNAVYVGYPATLMIPFDLKSYHCETNNGVLKSDDDNQLLLTAKRKGQIKILINKKSNNEVVDSIFLRALELPLPVAVIAGKHYGKISKEIIAQQETFYFKWQNVLTDVENISTKIVDSFKITILRSDKVIYNRQCLGYKFPEAAKNKLQLLKNGDLFIVNEIRGHLDSMEVEFNPIILEVED